jgi:electron transport complex protein RnfD
MTRVLACLAPGAAASAYFFGAGVVVNVAAAVATAAAVESAVAGLRRQSMLASLRDGSAFVTAAIVALALPPAAGVALTALAVTLALVVGKAIYGGLGANPFNPAMVGYAIVLVSFPDVLASWPRAPDATTAATALDVLKHRGAATVADVWTPSNGFGTLGAAGWEWINAAYLAGGLALVGLRLTDWRIPLAMLATLALFAALGYDAGSSASLGSPLFHLFSGATMLGAFFVATDPVTCPTDARGRLLFGALVGALLYALRSASVWPDAIAFAVLLGNAAAPLLARRPDAVGR